MTTTAAPRTDQVTQAGSGNGRPKCDGCRRCRNPEAHLCNVRHPECPGYHPICKVCRHCAFDGTHQDDAEDVRSGKHAHRMDITPKVSSN